MPAGSWAFAGSCDRSPRPQSVQLARQRTAPFGAAAPDPVLPVPVPGSAVRRLLYSRGQSAPPARRLPWPPPLFAAAGCEYGCCRRLVCAFLLPGRRSPPRTARFSGAECRHFAAVRRFLLRTVPPGCDGGRCRRAFAVCGAPPHRCLPALLPGERRFQWLPGRSCPLPGPGAAVFCVCPDCPAFPDPYPLAAPGSGSCRHPSRR